MNMMRFSAVLVVVVAVALLDQAAPISAACVDVVGTVGTAASGGFTSDIRKIFDKMFSATCGISINSDLTTAKTALAAVTIYQNADTTTVYQATTNTDAHKALAVTYAVLLAKKISSACYSATVAQVLAADTVTALTTTSTGVTGMTVSTFLQCFSSLAVSSAPASAAVHPILALTVGSVALHRLL